MRRTIYPANFRDFQPMLLSAEQKPFAREGWLFEPKADGMRAIVIVESGACRIYSRNGLEYSKHFPSLSKELESYNDLVLDGEIVACGADGQADFERLLERIHNPRNAAKADISNPVQLFAFDILSINQRQVMARKLLERKELLEQAVTNSQQIKKVFFTAVDGIAMFEACQRLGFEGIVAKHVESTYKPGTRCPRWKKIKQRIPADVVVCGYKKDDGILIAERDEHGQLQYAGTVRFGFRDVDHGYVRANAVVIDRSPISGAHPRATQWFAPEICAEVYAHGRTGNGILRNPVLKRLRTDLAIR